MARKYMSLKMLIAIPQNDSDVFNKVSGTTGLTGSADATFVLEKDVCEGVEDCYEKDVCAGSEICAE